MCACVLSNISYAYVCMVGSRTRMIARICYQVEGAHAGADSETRTKWAANKYKGEGDWDMMQLMLPAL